MMLAANARVDRGLQGRERARARVSIPPSSAAPLPLRHDAPRRISDLGADEIEGQIDAWRAASPALDRLILAGAPPASALRRLALTVWSSGDPRTASLLLTTAAALAPDSAEIWLDLGHTLHAVGDRGEALSSFAFALDLDPAPARAWLALAVIANELGDGARAEGAFLETLARDPCSHEAAFGLGLICFEQRRYAESARHWRAAVANGCANPMVHVGLGQSLFFLGDFKEAAKALGRHISRGGAEPKIVKRHALARYLDVAQGGDFDAARRAYLAAAGDHAEPIETLARSAFHILSAYGYAGTALRIGRELMAGSADDPIHRYLLAAVAGDPLARAPRDYIVAYFDRFADEFDAQLVDVLQYKAPEKLARMIKATGLELPRVLDLGCGTGIAGPLLKAGRQRLVGLDLSPRMLAKARGRGVYDELIEAEIVAYLENSTESFDLVLAADSLIYQGDLLPFFRAAAGVVSSGGILALSIENSRCTPYTLLPSGRFAHAPAGVIETAAPWFAPVARRRAFLRMEAHERVHGELMLFSRRDP